MIPERQHGPSGALDYLWALLSVGGAALVAAALRLGLSLPNPSPVFLFAVLFSAVRWGLRASIAAAVLSVLAYDFLFVPPHYTFTVSSSEDVLSLVVYLIVAVLISNLTGRIRDQAQAVRLREARTSALYDLSRRIAGELDVRRMGELIVESVARNLGGETALYMEGTEGTEGAGGTEGTGWGGGGLLLIAHSTDGGAAPATGDGWLRQPLSTAGRRVGLLVIRAPADRDLGEPEHRRFVEAIADLAAVGIERARLAREIEESKLSTERERLQSLLLSSISHDLRTPLASIIGAATALQEGSERYDATVRADLTSTIREEGERLDRFVGNILETTRLEAKAVHLNRELVEIGDIVGAAARHVSTRKGKRHLNVEIDHSLPMVNVDFVLIEQVLVNVLDNAVRYSPDGSSIAVRARSVDGNVVVEIDDDGPGIPPDDLEAVFDKFYRVRRSDRQAAGTGLGLSICRGIMVMHGAAIRATSPIRVGHGTRIELIFPAGEQPNAVESREEGDE